MRAHHRFALTLSAAAALSLSPSVARATNVQEFPDNGSEQMGRGGAWIARASDPLAAFYNPAGLAGQATRLTLQANVSLQSKCFTRVKATSDMTDDGVAPGAKYPEVCSDVTPFPNPQIGFTYALSDRLGLGLLVLGPSAVGNASWPEFVNGNQAAPQRYMLIDAHVVFLTPTLAVGWEALDNLRVGASFQFGTAPQIDFSNAAPALNANSGNDPPTNDIRSELTASQIFIPGFTLGTLWSPGDSIDVAGWYKWSAPIDTTGDVQTKAFYFTQDPRRITVGDTSLPGCSTPQPGQTLPPLCGSGNNAHIKVPIPMEAKVGARYHQPRASVPREPHRRDPLAQDAFDVEADFTWANNSSFDNLELRFPGTDLGTIPANPAVPGGTLPPNADVRHHYKDVFGVRLGGDYDVMPDQLAIRAGAFFETRGQDATYQNIDFAGSERFGVAVGGVYRVKLGSTGAHPLDLMLGYGHVFFATQDNSDPNAAGLSALSGSACNPGATPSNGKCPSGNQAYRTNWPINLGTITTSLNVVNVGASYRF